MEFGGMVLFPFENRILLDHPLQRPDYLGEIRYEFTYKIDFPKEILHSIFTARGWNLGNGFCLLGIYKNALLSYNVAQQIPLCHGKNTLLRVE